MATAGKGQIVKRSIIVIVLAFVAYAILSAVFGEDTIPAGPVIGAMIGVGIMTYAVPAKKK